MKKLLATCLTLTLAAPAMAQEIQEQLYPSGNIMAVGKLKDGMKQDTWKYFTDAPEATRVTTRVVNYLNDTLHGPYEAWVNDTHTKGTYHMGTQHGMHSVDRVVVNGMDSTLQWVETGEFNKGERTGYWKIYSNGMLESEGTYSKNKKNGAWKLYDVTEGKSELRSQLFFKDDLKDGKEIVYFSRDTKGNKVLQKRETFYLKGKKHGNFNVWENGKLMEKGGYKDDKLDGEFTRVDPKSGQKTSSYYMGGEKSGPHSIVDKDNNPIEQGAFDKGRKNGVWRYYESGKLAKQEEYSVGELSGDISYFDASGAVICKAKVEGGVRTEITGLRNGEPYIEVYLKDAKDKNVFMDVDMTYTDSVVSAGYRISSDMFSDELGLVKLFDNPGVQVVRDGAYAVTVAGKDVLRGFYTDGVKDGKWDLFHMNDVTWTQEFSKGKLVKESFTVGKDKAPFKGDYEAKDARSGLSYEFKIKDGLRHGKQSWTNSNGTVVKEDKYKEGVLQN